MVRSWRKGRKTTSQSSPLALCMVIRGELAGAGVEGIGVFGIDGGEPFGADDFLQHFNGSGEGIVIADLLADAGGEFVGGGQFALVVAQGQANEGKQAVDGEFEARSHQTPTNTVWLPWPLP